MTEQNPYPGAAAGQSADQAKDLQYADVEPAVRSEASTADPSIAEAGAPVKEADAGQVDEQAGSDLGWTQSEPAGTRESAGTQGLDGTRAPAGAGISEPADGPEADRVTAAEPEAAELEQQAPAEPPAGSSTVASDDGSDASSDPAADEPADPAVASWPAGDPNPDQPTAESGPATEPTVSTEPAETAEPQKDQVTEFESSGPAWESGPATESAGPDEAAAEFAGPVESAVPDPVDEDQEPPRDDTDPAAARVLTLQRRLDDLDELPIQEHPARYEALHAELTSALGQIDHPDSRA